MADINQLKSLEMQEIRDFCENVSDFGHVFHLEPKVLDEPFKKILEGISEIQKFMDNSWEM